MSLFRWSLIPDQSLPTRFYARSRSRIGQTPSGAFADRLFGTWEREIRSRNCMRARLFQRRGSRAYDINSWRQSGLSRSAQFLEQQGAFVRISGGPNPRRWAAPADATRAAEGRREDLV